MAARDVTTTFEFGFLDTTGFFGSFVRALGAVERGSQTSL
jgi:hypothetical protein